MSATNAIHGIVLLGGLLVIGEVDGVLQQGDPGRSRSPSARSTWSAASWSPTGCSRCSAEPAPEREGSDRRRRRRVTLATSFCRTTTSSRSSTSWPSRCSSSACAACTSPKTARRGNVIAAVGMAIAVVATLLIPEVGDYGLIAVGVAIGTVDRRPCRALGADDPDAADGGAVQRRRRRRRGADRAGRVPRDGRRPAARGSCIPILFAAIIGSISFWGSNIAFGKLQEILPGRPIRAARPAVHQRRAAADRGRLRRGHRRGLASPSCCSSRSWSRRRSSATCSCCPSAGRTCRWSSPC